MHDLNFRSVDEKGKPSWKVEVEPPENMDWIQYDVDPRMKIWKSMTGSGQDKQLLKAEEDLDELYHPSVVGLLQDQIQNLDPPSNILAEPFLGDTNTNYRQEPEDDRDDIDHPVFNEVAAEEPEQDWEEAYHKAREELAGYLAPMVLKNMVGVPYVEEKNEDHHMKSVGEVRVHLQPEEDMDDIYHKDIFIPVLHDDTKAPPPADLQFQRKYSEPEEDMDHVYHH